MTTKKKACVVGNYVEIECQSRKQSNTTVDVISVNKGKGTIKLARVCPGPYVYWKTVRESSERVKWRVDDELDHDSETSIMTSTYRSSDPLLNDIKQELAVKRNAQKFMWDLRKAEQEIQERSSYKLISFEGKGQAELIRLLLTAVEVPFEDSRLTLDEFDDMKGTTPYKALPVISKGSVLWGGVSAIVRTLAHKYLMMGTTIKDNLKVDAVYERLRRIQTTHAKPLGYVTTGEKNKDKMEWAQSQLTHVVLPHVFQEWEALIKTSPGPFIIDRMTLADIAIMDFVDQVSQNLLMQPILVPFPAVSDLITMVQRNARIKKYLKENSDKD